MKKFPKVKGSNLEGKDYTLPYDLEGEYNLVIIPFLQYQQLIVNPWVDYLTNLQKKFPFFEFYEIPTLSIGYTPMKFMIDGGMKAGIADLIARQRTITIYINKIKFKKKLGIKTEKIIYIYLLKNDEILWEETGDFSDEKVKNLENILSKIVRE
jgi:hypothetical protein